MTNGVRFEMRRELFHPIHNLMTIEDLGWQVKGEFAAHDYQIMDADENVLATAHRKWFSLHNIYYLDVLDEEKRDLIVAAYIVLEHMLNDLETATVAGSAGTTPSTPQE